MEPCSLDISPRKLSDWQAHLLRKYEQQRLGEHISACSACQTLLREYEAGIVALRALPNPISGQAVWRGAQSHLDNGDQNAMTQTTKNLTLGGLATAICLIIIFTIVFVTHENPIKRSSTSLQATPTATLPPTATAIPQIPMYVAIKNHSVISYDLSSGEKLWQVAITTEDDYSAQVGLPINNVVYVSTNSAILALNAADGAELWSFSTPFSDNGDRPLPIINQGKLYEVDGTNKFTVLNAIDGTLQWSFSGDDHNPNHFSDRVQPIINNGIIYFGSTTLYAIDIHTHAQLWKYHDDYEDFTIGPMTIENGKIYFAVDFRSFYAINLSDGSLGWLFRSNGYLSPLVESDRVILNFGTDSTYDNIVGAFDASTGQNIWQNTYGTREIHREIISQNHILYFWDDADNIVAVNDKDGSLLWSRHSDANGNAEPLDRVLLLFSNKTLLELGSAAIDVNTGSMLWAWPQEVSIGFSVGFVNFTALNGNLYFVTEQGCDYCGTETRSVYAISSSGELLWKDEFRFGQG